MSAHRFARYFAIVFLGLSFFSLHVFAAPAPSSEAASKILTPEQALNLRRIFDLHFSPHGSRLAFTVLEPPKGVENSTHIWILDVASKKIRQYTFSAKSESFPRWSPDGKFLAFLSNRDGDNTQIYLAPSSGGDAFAVTQGKRNVSAFAWSPDGRQIAFLAPDAPTAAELKKKKDKNDAIVVDKSAKHTRVWILDVATKKVRAITDGKWQVRELAWLPSGNRLVISATDRPQSDDETNRIFSLDVSSGQMTQLVAPKGPFGDIRVSPDGKQFAYLAPRVDGPIPHDVYLHSTSAQSSAASRNLTAASIDRAMNSIEWSSDGNLLAVAQTGFRTTLYSIAADGHANALENISPNPRVVAISKSGAVAFVGQTATRPPEVYLASPGAPAERVTDLNASWNSISLAPPEYFQYRSFDGLPIQGELLKPLGYDGHSRVPLVVLVHGGPTGAWSDSIDTWGQLLAARGFAVAYFNIRGSTGYGEKFMEMNRADWGGADYRDVMAGVDYLIAQGIADPNRLGIGGWSYGGYMSEWAITQTNRFKAAVSGAGMVDLIAEFDTERGPSYDKWFWGLPYGHPEGFLKHSPFMYLQNAHTPILILQGIADTTDPLGQSTGLYRGLKFYGDTAELVEYPRENHGFHEQLHELDRLNRIIAWYQKYLK